MTNIAYALFTFMACMAGIGIGLVLHQVSSRVKSVIGTPADPFSSIADGETASWDAFANWQAANNRRFATQVACCGAAPLLFAAVAFTQRADVVQSVCDTITKVAGQAYICM